MTLKGMRKCCSCWRFYNSDEMDFVMFGDEAGKMICQVCASEDFVEPEATVVLYDKGFKKLVMTVGYYNYRITDDVGLLVADATDEWDLSGEYDDEVELLDRYAKSIEWSGRGYRGAYEGNINDNMIRVIDSWFGMGGYNINGDLEAIRLRVEEARDFPNFLMLMCFTRTSNVCSTGVEVYIKKDDKLNYKKWLEVINE